MQVTVRLFAMLRERAGASEVTLELPDGARVRDAIAALDGVVDDLPVVMAVNREYAPDDAVLDPGDELALIPPVSGGAVAGSNVIAYRTTNTPILPPSDTSEMPISCMAGKNRTMLEKFVSISPPPRRNAR